MTNRYGDTTDANGYVKSILQDEDEKECFLCSYTGTLIRHEVFQGNPNRRISKETGLWVNLCPLCHYYIHQHPKSIEAVALDKYAQTRAMEEYGLTTQKFIELMGRNYL